MIGEVSQFLRNPLRVPYGHTEQVLLYTHLSDDTHCSLTLKVHGVILILSFVPSCDTLHIGVDHSPNAAPSICLLLLLIEDVYKRQGVTIVGITVVRSKRVTTQVQLSIVINLSLIHIYRCYHRRY